jgi:hypothetical protein
MWMHLICRTVTILVEDYRIVGLIQFGGCVCNVPDVLLITGQSGVQPRGCGGGSALCDARNGIFLHQHRVRTFCICVRLVFALQYELLQCDSNSIVMRISILLHLGFAK